MLLRVFVAVLASLATAWLTPLLAAPLARPNIVFFFADDVGQEVLGCYGGTSFATPHLDRLAAQGIRFRHAYSMPTCHPSRVCLLTGRYPFRIGNPNWGSFPRELESQTVVQVLKRAGYQTAIAGKWQLTFLGRNPLHPHALGFDDSCLFGWHEGPRYYRPFIWQNGERRPELAERYGPDVYTDFLVRFMERNRERPFFAFYSMAFCHDVSNDFDEPVPRGPRGRYDSYGEMAEGMDERVGRVLAAIDRLGLRERTLVVFTTDNGTPKTYIATAEDGKLVKKEIVARVGGQRVRGGKGELTDAGTRVPLLVSWPGTIASGQVVDDLIDLSDFLPTFADLAGSTPPPGVRLDGQSFAARLREGTAGPRRWAFAEGRKGKRFVRTQRFKLYSDGLFYDVEADRLERDPLDPETLDPAAREISRHLATALESLGR